MEAGTTPNGVFGGEADVGLLRRLRQPAAQRPRLQRPAARGAAARGLPRSHLRPRRAREQGAPGGLAVEGGADRDLAPGGRRGRRAGRQRRRLAAVQELPRTTTGRSCASTTARSSTCCTRSWSRRRTGTRSSSMRGSSRCWSSTRTSPPTTRAATRNVLERLGLEAPEDLELAPRMKKQSDGINDDWTRRYCGPQARHRVRPRRRPSRTTA